MPTRRASSAPTARWSRRSAAPPGTSTAAPSSTPTGSPARCSGRSTRWTGGAAIQQRVQRGARHHPGLDRQVDGAGAALDPRGRCPHRAAGAQSRPLQDRVDLRDPAKRAALIQALERQMREAAANLEFELAALLRDQLNELKAIGRARRAPRLPSGRVRRGRDPLAHAEAELEAEGEALGRRALAPGELVTLRGRPRGGEDHVDQGGRPRARRHRAGHQPDLCAGASLPGPPRAGLPSRLLPAADPGRGGRPRLGRACWPRETPFWSSGPSGPAPGSPRPAAASACITWPIRRAGVWSRSDVPGAGHRHRSGVGGAWAPRRPMPSRRASAARGAMRGACCPWSQRRSRAGASRR